MEESLFSKIKNNKFFNLFRIIKISYCITVCNEAKELDKLLSTLIPLIGKRDEIIVLQDITSKNDAVSQIINNYRSNLTLIEAFLNNDFASFKNNFFDVAKGNYLFQIDADEIPTQSLIEKIKSVLKKRRKNDCFRVPRINIVNGYKPLHANKWNWNINEKNYINFPDYQPRIVKLNSSIRWKNKVHEVFTGYVNPFELPAENEDFCLLHIKDIKKQEQQNEFYDQLT